MKAAVYHRYGSPDVICVTQTDQPVPKPGEVLIRVMAASLGAYDCHLLRAQPFFTRALSGWFRPKNTIPGADIAGVVAAVADDSDYAGGYKVGDAVYGCLESCGKGGLAAGGLAEYVCAKTSVLAPKSEMLSFEEAAALPMAAVTAMQAVRNAQIAPGDTVLINGASGGVGAFAVQIAKASGANVTGVCRAESMAFVRSLGADVVIDYQKTPAADGSRQYDVILDVAANLSVKEYRRALKPNGRCRVIGFSTLRHTLRYSLAGVRDGKHIRLAVTNNKNGSDLLEINRLIEAGLLKPVVDSRFTLEETADAFRRVEAGHPKGKVVIVVSLSCEG